MLYFTLVSELSLVLKEPSYRYMYSQVLFCIPLIIFTFIFELNISGICDLRILIG